MMDDDIVFLGTRNVLSPPNLPPAQRPVTGIALHIEKSGSIDAYGMLFRRANTSVVHIGRRSGADVDRRSQDAEQGSAMFRCAVVSRKHAKIAFSDSGHAYLIDLGSHHGTHLRKPGEKFAKALKPETPSLLSNGDFVTFGKSVGKNEDCVRPVVARIELLYGPSNTVNPSSTIKPLIVPSANSSPFSDKSSLKSISGRYGIHSSSSSDESSNSGIYSDIEEISPPPSSSKQTSKPATSQGTGSGSFENAINVLKRLLPPSHPPGDQRDKDLPSPPPHVPALSSLFWYPFGPDSGLGSPGLQNLPSLFTSSLTRDPSPFLAPLEFPSDDSQDSLSDIPGFSHKSRSNSPMDLASPSPAAELIVSRPLSLPPVPQPPTACRIEGPPTSIIASPGSTNSPGAATPKGLLVSETDKPHPDLIEFEPDVSVEEVNYLKLKVERLETEVTRLQNHRRKYKSRFNNNVQVITEKLGEFDDRLAEVNAEYTILFDQVDTIHHVDIPDLQAQYEGLQDKMDGLPSPFSTPAPRERTPQPMAEREDVRNIVKSFDGTANEIRQLRDDMRKEMNAELENFKSIRDKLMSEVTQENTRLLALVEEAQAQAKQTLVLPSLKRKRDDIDENEDVDEKSASELESKSSEGQAEGGDVVMDDVAVPATTPKVLDDNSPRPRKRARRFASVVAQTATAVTIGAVVTWSALAFT